MLTRQIEIRDAAVVTDPGGRAHIEGTAVPYDHTITYAGQAERFAPGSIDATQVVGRPLMYGHNYSDPAAWMGTITDAENTDTGLHINAEVVDVDMAGKLRQASVAPGLSVGVQIDDATQEDDGSVTYHSATLRELSITVIPAYESESMIETVRNRPKEDTTVTESTAPAVAAEAVDLTPYATREMLAELEGRMAAPTPPARPLGVVDGFTRMLADYAERRQTRALADVLSSGNSGVLPPQWASEVLGYLDSSRYLFSAAGTVGFPSVGYSLTFPRIQQRTTVAARGTEKTEVASQAFQTTETTYTAAWFAGAVDVAVELIMQSDPAILSLVSQDLLAQYAVATEEAFVASVEGTGTAHGAVLDTATYAGLIADLVGVSETIRQATGSPGDMVAAITADWQAILGLMDGDGRRVLAGGGATNSDGSANLIAQSVNVGGITVFHSPYSTESVQFNDTSLRKAEKPPVQLATDNVALMGRDLGVLGATMALPIYTGGIIRYAAV